MIILQDTREKQPWLFEDYNQIATGLKTGDYQIDGCPYLITIDRKKVVTELANNIVTKRFERELQRMVDYRFRYVICEFPYKEVVAYPQTAKLPKHIKDKIRVKGRFLTKELGRLSEEYETEFIFCDNRYEAKSKAKELLVQAYELR